MKPKIAILASGSGTTAEAVIRASAGGRVNYDVVLVIVSREDAGIFERVERLNAELGLNIPAILINHQAHPAEGGEVVPRGLQTDPEQEAIRQAIESAGVDVVALMGYMKKIGPRLVERYGWQDEYTSPFQAMMLNTHPGLLPETKALFGLGIQSYVLDNKLPYGGQSLHVVAEEYDACPVVSEHRVKVEPGDTAESLFERVQKTEKEFLPGDIEQFIINRREYLSHNPSEHGYLNEHSSGR